MLSKLFLLPKSLLLCLLLNHVNHVLADTPPFLNNQKFENGDYGAYPTQRFHSSQAVAPRMDILSTHTRCNDGSYTMMNPRGYAVPEEARGPVIMDSMGNLVWAATGYEQTYDLMAQDYRGERYLTFWSGDDAIGGHGAGEYIMLNSAYQEYKRIRAANGMKADLHEFRFTEAGTALITVYDVRPADLSEHGGPERGYIWDSLFQEIDIETGTLIFQWRASDHFKTTDSFHALGDAGSRGNPYDYFHINSVERDRSGNYLISSRYTSTISYIDGRSGSVYWRLGGKRNSFKDLSQGRATDFKFQHDARWYDDYSTISIFNNGAEAPDQKDNAPYSRAMKVRIDSTYMTARLETQYINTQQISSSSQGSMQVLPNGDVLVGYGSNSLYTEFAPNGVVLCETHFGAASHFHSGDVQSYRVMKFNWTGTPETSPSITIADGSTYVSWNGATEVRQWVLETGEEHASAGYEPEIRWQVAKVVDKSGFETQIEMPGNFESYIRIVALDQAGKSIGATTAVKVDQVSKIGRLNWNEANARVLLFLAFCMSLISFGALFSWLLPNARRSWKGYSKLLPDDEV